MLERVASVPGVQTASVASVVPLFAGGFARTVFLEVDEKNAPAGQLYRKAGFYDVGRRQGYYEGGAAALALRRDLS